MENEIRISAQRGFIDFSCVGCSLSHFRRSVRRKADRLGQFALGRNSEL